MLQADPRSATQPNPGTSPTRLENFLAALGPHLGAPGGWWRTNKNPVRMGVRTGLAGGRVGESVARGRVKRTVDCSAAADEFRVVVAVWLKQDIDTARRSDVNEKCGTIFAADGNLVLADVVGIVNRVTVGHVMDS